MTLSNQAARRKEYPEMGSDFRMEMDPKLQRPKRIEVRVPITDVFYLTFIDPNTTKYVRHAIGYSKKVTRIADEDLRNFEQECGARPSLVQKELYYVHNSATGLWVDIKGAKNHWSHYEDCTKDYYDIWRPNAYPKDGPFEDPFKGKSRPDSVDPTKFRLDMSERRLALMDAKERGHAMPMATHVTPGVASIGEGSLVAMGEAHVEHKGRAAFSQGAPNTNSGDPLGFIPSEG